MFALDDLLETDPGTITWNDEDRAGELQAAYAAASPGLRALLIGTHSLRRLSPDEHDAAVRAIHHTTVDKDSLCTTCCRTAALPAVKLCKRHALHLITQNRA